MLTTNKIFSFVSSLSLCTTLLLFTIPCFGQSSDSVLVSKLREEGVTFSHDNSIKLLMNGQEKFDNLFRDIREAKESVHLEYFNFRNDSIADLLFDILAEKAAEGVEVRALYDAFGNSSNNQPLRKRHIKKQRERGIDIHEFDPIRFPWVNHIFGRDHRKIVIIDGKIAYTGGMNVADYYIKGTPVVGDWRDMHCRLTGTEVNTLQDIFMRAWTKVTRQQVIGEKYYKGSQGQVPMTQCSGSAEPVPVTPTLVGVINREPHRSPKAVRQFYLHAINSAQDTIRIVNPYFTLIPSIKKAIINAVKRGVEVEIMLAAPSDIPLTPDCAFYNANLMRKKGCKVWIYKPGFHHTKIIMVDGKYCTVGSTNLDSRSLRCDYEENLAIIDAEVTRQLNDMFQRDKKESFFLTKESYRQWRSKGKRIRSWFAHLLAPFL